MDLWDLVSVGAGWLDHSDGEWEVWISGWEHLCFLIAKCTNPDLLSSRMQGSCFWDQLSPDLQWLAWRKAPKLPLKRVPQRPCCTKHHLATVWPFAFDGLESGWTPIHRCIHFCQVVTFLRTVTTNLTSSIDFLLSRAWNLDATRTQHRMQFAIDFQCISQWTSPKLVEIRRISLNRILDRSSPTPRVARDAAHVTCSADVHLGYETYEAFDNLFWIPHFECCHHCHTFVWFAFWR